MEYVAPKEFGAPQREYSFKVVDYETADRSGKPFIEALQVSADYRKKEKNLPPSFLGVKSRQCTNYMKIRVMHKYALSLSPLGYDKFVGLRADEPKRVAALMIANTQAVTHITPLADAGITKKDVLGFWSLQDFDLEIPDYLGNCNKCYLKSVPSLARSMWEEPGDVQWWLDLQENYGDFRRGKQPMRDIFAEAPLRMEVISPALDAGLIPECPEGVDQKRFRSILKQEIRYRKEKPTFSCACEAAQGSFDSDLD